MAKPYAYTDRIELNLEKVTAITTDPQIDDEPTTILTTVYGQGFPKGGLSARLHQDELDALHKAWAKAIK